MCEKVGFRDCPVVDGLWTDSRVCSAPHSLLHKSLTHLRSFHQYLTHSVIVRQRDTQHDPAAHRARRGARARAAGGRDRRAGQARALAVALADAAGGRGRGALLVPKEMTETTEMETEPVDEHAAACERAAYGPQMKMSKKIQLDDAVDSSVAVEEAPVLLNADVEVQVADQVAPDVTAEDTEDADAGVKVNPVRRRSMQLPAPLLVKTLGDVSSPSLSATESEDDEEELTLTTRSYASRSTAASPMRAAAAMSPAPPTSGRKIRPRSSSSSSGFSVANRKRLLGSPVRQPHFHPQPQPHPHSSTSSSSAATARPSHPTGMMMTPVRNRRAATVTSNPSTGSSKSQSSTHSSSSGGFIKRNAFVRRSAASERELMQEKMAADGYWIGDFRLERQLVARRSFLSKDGGNGSGNNSARSSPRAV